MRDIQYQSETKGYIRAVAIRAIAVCADARDTQDGACKSIALEGRPESVPGHIQEYPGLLGPNAGSIPLNFPVVFDGHSIIILIDQTSSSAMMLSWNRVSRGFKEQEAPDSWQSSWRVFHDLDGVHGSSIRADTPEDISDG